MIIGSTVQPSQRTGITCIRFSPGLPSEASRLTEKIIELSSPTPLATIQISASGADKVHKKHSDVTVADETLEHNHAQAVRIQFPETVSVTSLTVCIQTQENRSCTRIAVNQSRAYLYDKEGEYYDAIQMIVRCGTCAALQYNVERFKKSSKCSFVLQSAATVEPLLYQPLLIKQ